MQKAHLRGLFAFHCPPFWLWAMPLRNAQKKLAEASFFRYRNLFAGILDVRLSGPFGAMPLRQIKKGICARQIPFLFP